jgi:hypothetical protein
LYAKTNNGNPAPLFRKFTQKGAGNRENEVLSRLPRPGGLQVPCGCKVTLDKEKIKNKDYENSRKEKKKAFAGPGQQASHTQTHT